MEMKKLIVFDLDGTLTKSKTNLDKEMSEVMTTLLNKYKVAVIGGGSYEQFKRQFIKHLKVEKKLLKKLFLFPTSSTSFYRYEDGWKCVYKHDLTDNEKKKIFDAFSKVLVSHKPEKVWGEIVEDRGSQITFSALGQKAPIDKKSEWDPNQKKEKSLLNN